RDLPNWTLARLKADSLPAARAYLKASHRLNDQELAAMSDDQAIALYLVGRHRELNDEVSKTAYLPPRDALPQLAAPEKRLKPDESGPLALSLMNLRAIESMYKSTVWPDRQIALLLAIEAIRLYAAAHDGQLPETLDQVTEVPLPEDPATGKPFLYRR